MSTDNFSGIVQNNSTNLNIILPDSASPVDDVYKDFFIEINNKHIRKIRSYNGASKTITLDYELSVPVTPTVDTFYISSIVPKTTFDGALLQNSTNINLILPALANIIDGYYNNFYIEITSGKSKGNIRQIIAYKDDNATLDFKLSDIPDKDDTFSIYSSFFNKYTLLGINFSFMSGIIDSIGGLFNFEISTAIFCIICLMCLSSVSIVILTQSTKNKKNGHKGRDKHGGLNIPGIGRLGPHQPLIIQMPMQTAPFRFGRRK